MLILSRYNRRPRNPRPGRRLSRGFLAAFGKPAGLWVPTPGLGPKAYDFAPSGLGAGNVGPLNGGITTTPGGFGTLGAVWSFDGSTGDIDLSSVASKLNLSGVITVSVLAANNGAGSGQPALIGGSPDKVINFYPNGNGAGVSGIVISLGWKTWAYDVISSSAIANGIYTLYTIVIGTTTLRVYVNTTASWSSARTTSPASFSGLHLGNRAAAGTGFFKGNSPFFAAWQAEFSAAQVSSLYQSLLTGEPFPLFAASASERWMANVTAPAGTNWPWFISDGFGYLIGA